MNVCLNDIYKELQEKFLADVKSNNLVLDKFWSKDIYGITLEIDLSDSVKDVVRRLQDLLKEKEADSLLLPDKEYMHISFNQVVFWNQEYSLSREEFWNHIKDEFISKFNNLDNKFNSFEVTFNKVLILKDSIILVATDNNDQMQYLREAFKQSLPFPKENTKFNNIIHTTVARYSDYLKSPNDLIDITKDFKVSTKMEVNKIILKEIIKFPSMEQNKISEINLI